jgi:hypothetical protein
MTQKFKRGDVVHIAENLGRMMDYFEKDKDVVILYSYNDKFGGGGTKDYHVMFLDDGHECAWYKEYQLTFLRHGGEDLIVEIKNARVEREKKESDLGWIVENWKNIKHCVPGASMIKLMNEIGITNPWGLHGEGIDLLSHQLFTLAQFEPVLETGDLAKVKEFIEKFPKIKGQLFSTNFYNA